MKEIKEKDLLFAKVNLEAIIPSKEDENAGYDIYACFDEDYLVIPAHSTKLIPTGIACALSGKYYLQVHERGSTGKIGMKVGAGVVDSSYRGEIFVCLNNINDVDIIISKHSREELIEYFSDNTDNDKDSTLANYIINDDTKVYLEQYTVEDNKTCIIYPYNKAIAQLLVHEVPDMNIYEVSFDELKNIPSNRGNGSLGSSGK